MKTRSEIYDDGWEACYEGESRDDCPYTFGSSNYTHWNDGWWAAMGMMIDIDDEDDI